MTSVALDLDAVIGDTWPLWRAWLADLERRVRLEGLDLPEERPAAALALDARVGNWRALLERFAEEHAPVHLRPDAATSAALRSLSARGCRLGAYTDAPAELARVALAQLGATRRLAVVEAGADALSRLLTELGTDSIVVRSRGELAALNL